MTEKLKQFEVILTHSDVQSLSVRRLSFLLESVADAWDRIDPAPVNARQKRASESIGHGLAMMREIIEDMEKQGIESTSAYRELNSILRSEPDAPAAVFA
ncbi:hypothetical protein JXA40_04475 [bacterium]|nr:hypothetical protein [candidate division CSSED10-310 bacterium]